MRERRQGRGKDGKESGGGRNDELADLIVETESTFLSMNSVRSALAQVNRWEKISNERTLVEEERGRKEGNMTWRRLSSTLFAFPSSLSFPPPSP